MTLLMALYLTGILPEFSVRRWSDIDIPSENVCLY